MYTVIIAERQFIDLCGELGVFLKPLQSPDVVFCEWDRSGKNVEEMLPELKKLTEFHREWRAVIVNEDRPEQVNPFDYTGYKDEFTGPAPRGSMEKLLARRDSRLDSFRRATENPLTRLTTALTGIPTFSYQIEDAAALESVLSGETDLREYMLRRQLADLRLAETANRLEAYGRQALLSFVAPEDIDGLIAAVRAGDAQTLLDSVDTEQLPSFISLLGNGDIIHSDVEYNEGLVENTVKSSIMKALAEDYHLKDTLPAEVICFAPRTCDYDTYLHVAGGEVPEESDYSAFAEYNLFHDKVKFMVYDLAPSDSNLYAAERMKMVCCLMVLAGNRLPAGCVSQGRVYALSLEMDEGAVRETFSEYFGKLKATADLITETTRELERVAAQPLDNATSRELFEQDVQVPVEVPDYRRSDFHTEDKDLGLAKDCPQEELGYWRGQYRAVEKKFIRFLREPRRAMKAAVAGPFRDGSSVKDERIFRLNENQREDVAIKMQEEEWEMVETNPPGLMNEENYRKQLREADEEVQREIGQRMTRSRTLLAGGIALAVYVAGFLPLFFSGVNTTKSFVACLLMTLAAAAVFAGAGVAFLYAMRRRLKSRISAFNSVMSGVLAQVESAMAGFAAYLGHACSYMRGASVMYTDESDTEKKKRILAHHLNAVKEASDSATELFSKFMDCDQMASKEAEPYLNDYTVMGRYDFPVPFRPEGRRIEFIQPGCQIKVPADFIVSITLNRVELYD